MYGFTKLAVWWSLGAEKLSSVWAWAVRSLAALSQLLNTLLLLGHPNETISAKCYLKRDMRGWGFAYKAINVLFFWQDDHCKQSHLDDLRHCEQYFDKECP